MTRRFSFSYLKALETNNYIILILSLIIIIIIIKQLKMTHTQSNNRGDKVAMANAIKFFENQKNL